MVQHFMAFMDALPPLPVLVLCIAVTSPFVTAVHELGHAVVALSRSDGPVTIVVAWWLGTFRLRSGRLGLALERLRGIGGLCLYDPTGLTGNEQAAISLAGPAASLAGAVVTGTLMGHTEGLTHALLAVATLEGAVGFAMSILPMSYRPTRNSPPVSMDGLSALQALRRPRASHAARMTAGDTKAGPVAARWAAEVDAASERARADRARANVGRIRAREAERRSGSVPPPGA